MEGRGGERRGEEKRGEEKGLCVFNLVVCCNLYCNVLLLGSVSAVKRSC